MSEVRCRRSEDGRQRTDVGGQMSEVGGRMSDVGGRRSEDRGQKSEVRGWDSAKRLRSPSYDPIKRRDKMARQAKTKELSLAARSPSTSLRVARRSQTIACRPGVAGSYDGQAWPAI